MCHILLPIVFKIILAVGCKKSKVILMLRQLLLNSKRFRIMYWFKQGKSKANSFLIYFLAWNSIYYSVTSKQDMKKKKTLQGQLLMTLSKKLLILVDVLER